MQREIDYLEKVQGVNFRSIFSLKRSDHRYKGFFNFNGSCESNCSLKISVGFVTAGCNGELIFYQIKMSADVDLQNTQSDFFNFSCDVVQVSTLSTQLSCG